MRREWLFVVAMIAGAVWWGARAPEPQPPPPGEGADVPASSTPSAARVVPPVDPPPRLIDPAPRSVRGRVVDEAGAPIVGALVGVGVGTGAAIATDATGSFTVAGVPAEAVNVYAVAPGRASAQRRVEPSVDYVELSLTRGARLRARLQAAAGDELLASVCRTGAPDSVGLCVARIVVPQGQRELIFDRLPAGTHELVLERGERALARVPVVIRAGEEVVLDRVGGDAPAL